MLRPGFDSRHSLLETFRFLLFIRDSKKLQRNSSVFSIDFNDSLSIRQSRYILQGPQKCPGRIWIHNSVSWIQGSRSVRNIYGSRTVEGTNLDPLRCWRADRSWIRIRYSDTRICGSGYVRNIQILTIYQRFRKISEKSSVF